MLDLFVEHQRSTHNLHRSDVTVTILLILLRDNLSIQKLGLAGSKGCASDRLANDRAVALVAVLWGDGRSNGTQQNPERRVILPRLAGRLGVCRPAPSLTCSVGFTMQC